MNEDLKEFANILFAPSERDMYKKRIKKAINYIENEDIEVCTIRNNDIQDTKKELLDILKGSEDND